MLSRAILRGTSRRVANGATRAFPDAVSYRRTISTCTINIFISKTLSILAGRQPRNSRLLAGNVYRIIRILTSHVDSVRHYDLEIPCEDFCSKLRECSTIKCVHFRNIELDRKKQIADEHSHC